MSNNNSDLSLEYQVLQASKKDTDDSKILAKLDTITDHVVEVTDNKVVLLLKDLCLLTITSTLEGFQVAFSDPERYLGNDTPTTLLSYDRVMYILDTVAEEVRLKIY